MGARLRNLGFVGHEYLEGGVEARFSFLKGPGHLNHFEERDVRSDALGQGSNVREHGLREEGSIKTNEYAHLLFSFSE
jgi:hypothetical protein